MTSTSCLGIFRTGASHGGPRRLILKKICQNFFNVKKIRRKGSIYSVMTNSESPNSLFHLEILNSDLQTKVWGYYLQSLQTFGAKVFADFRGKSLQTLEVITIQSFREKEWPLIQRPLIQCHLLICVDFCLFYTFCA